MLVSDRYHIVHVLFSQPITEILIKIVLTRKGGNWKAIQFEGCCMLRQSFWALITRPVITSLKI